jgi:diadenosine tetraphosphatase ApaH/serine/threonine PP2A family protein phosphatase
LYGNNDDLKPKFHNNLVMVDTGAGFNGKLTFINPDTLEFVQSIQQT